MFSSALKSFSSNITSNYTLESQPTSASGPWRIYEAKRKSTGKPVSVFVFDRKSLDQQGGSLGGRSGGPSLKQAHQEVVTKLKQEAGALARLRHPSVLELVEPVEETRNGGLMFATELVTASLSSLLADLDDGERPGRGGRSRASRFTLQDPEGSSQSKEFELDELEIQKGLLQISKGLEFLHESAGLVHSNLTPDSIIINAKGDWKLAGMAFTGPVADSDKATSFQSIFLSEVLNHDPRIPASVQINLDYTSPDFVLDNQVVSSADMFSLGMIILSLYNSPHKSPIECHGSLSSFKRAFSSASTVPSQSNNFLIKGNLPVKLAAELLPKLITRRPAARLTAKSFQQAQYFDNILVSTIRFLDALPGKSAIEKSQFLKGLPRIMPQFPSSVLERKILPILLDEMKDKDLLSAILQNVFSIIKASADAKRPFIDTVIPKLREVFLQAPKAGSAERDLSKEAGLMVVLEQMQVVADSTSGKEFRDDILPIIAVGLNSPTHTVIDASLATLPHVTPKLDYSTIKNELFPVIANVFAHTSSLGIKIQGLEAFWTLCGGSEDNNLGDGLDGNVTHHAQDKSTTSSVLDKFTIQERVVPMLKAIKTKEPAVMMAALKVFKQIGSVVDTDYLATEILPILWSFALGPLLDLAQFQAFMSLIKSLSSRIEREHSHKLQELKSSNASATLRSGRTPAGNGADAASTNGAADVDFESLVSGRSGNATPDIINEWDPGAQAKPTTITKSGTAWSTPAVTLRPVAQPSVLSTSTLRPQTTLAANRTVTPDQSLLAFSSLTPSSAFNAPLQPIPRTTPTPSPYTIHPPKPQIQQQRPTAASRIDWSAASAARNNPHIAAPGYSSSSLGGPAGGTGVYQQRAGSANTGQVGMRPTQPPPQQNKAANGLDRYESLL